MTTARDETPQLVNIVPRLFPSICGVGEAAVRLAHRLRERAFETAFIAGDVDAVSERPAGSDLLPLRSRSAKELSSLLRDRDKVLLHFVGYGYNRRGCPFWLAESLCRWARVPGHRLVILFHELYATGPPWTSSFWLSRAQRSIARTLAEAAALCIATRRSVADELSSWLGNGRVQFLPIFSTIGEITDPAPLHGRSRTLAVFGSAGMRARAYRCSDALRLACDILEIDEIVDIGPPIGEDFDVEAPRPMKQLGMLLAAQISATLETVTAGFISYRPFCLAKSSIFAAYSSHRLIPVCAENARSEADGLIAGVHYLVPRDGGSEAAAGLAGAAFEWYRAHSIDRYADVIQQAFCSGSEHVGGEKS